MSQQPTNDQPVVKLEIEVTADTSHDLGVLFAEEGWENAEGLRLVIGAGLGTVRARRAMQSMQAGENLDATLDRLMSRLMEVESSLAVTRFRLYEYQQANQGWELSTGAIRRENLGFQGVLERKRNELSALNDRVRALENENTALKSLLGETHEQPAAALTPEKPPSARQHVFKRIKRWVDSKRD